MNDEEKKAIEFFEKSFKKKIPPYWYDDTISNIEEKIKTVLNLIEKQQKEIEELKEKNKRLEKFIENGEHTWKQKYNETFKYVENEFVSKAKIKAKIEEYEKALNILLQKYEWIEPSDTIIRNKFIHYIEFGQSLLEKE